MKSKKLKKLHLSVCIGKDKLKKVKRNKPEDIMSSEIRDINLAESGERKIEWVKRNCDLLRMLEEEFGKTKPFAGKKVALSVHLEAKTAYLCKVLAAGGAEMYVTGSNPLSTQDDVAAALVAAGLEVHAWYDATEEEYNHHIRKLILHL